MTEDKEYFAIKKASELIGVSYSYLAKLCKEGAVEAVRVPALRGSHDKYMIPDHEVERLMLVREGKASGMKMRLTKEGVSVRVGTDVESLKKWVLEVIENSGLRDALTDSYTKGYMDGFRAGFEKRANFDDKQ